MFLRFGVFVAQLGLIAALAGMIPAQAAGLPSAGPLARPPISAGPVESAGKCAANRGAVNPGPGASNAVELEPCNGKPGGQLWTIEADSTIRIWGKCLEAGARVRLAACDG